MVGMVQYENRKAQNIQEKEEEIKKFIPRLIKVPLKVESQKCDWISISFSYGKYIYENGDKGGKEK